jgi:membrane protein DedA with SNARE-associated domain
VYKYVLLFLVTFSAAIILPIPSAATLVASAILAAHGQFNIWLVVLVAILGNVMGDNLCYWLARSFGEPVLNKLGFKKYLRSPVYFSLQKHFTKHSGVIVTFTRFEVISTISANLLSGLSNLSYFKFLLFDILGETIQVLCFSGAGYLFGEQWQSVNGVIGKVFLVVTLGGLITVVFLWQRIAKYLIKHPNP